MIPSPLPTGGQAVPAEGGAGRLSLAPPRGEGKEPRKEFYGEKMGSPGRNLQPEVSSRDWRVGQPWQIRVSCDEKSNRGKISGGNLPGQSRQTGNYRTQSLPFSSSGPWTSGSLHHCPSCRTGPPN